MTLNWSPFSQSPLPTTLRQRGYDGVRTRQYLPDQSGIGDRPTSTSPWVESLTLRFYVLPQPHPIDNDRCEFWMKARRCRRLRASSVRVAGRRPTRDCFACGWHVSPHHTYDLYHADKIVYPLIHADYIQDEASLAQVLRTICRDYYCRVRLCPSTSAALYSRPFFPSPFLGRLTEDDIGQNPEMTRYAGYSGVEISIQGQKLVRHGTPTKRRGPGLGLEYAATLG